MHYRCFAILLFVVLATACSSSRDRELEGAGLLEKEVYDRAVSALESNLSRTAIEYLQLLEAQFPFGAYAEQGQLE